jgi:hypothetical protein
MQIPKPKPQPESQQSLRTLGAMPSGTGMASYRPAAPNAQDKTSFDTGSNSSASTYAALPPKSPAAIHGAMQLTVPQPAAAPASSSPIEGRMSQRYSATASSKVEKDFPAAGTTTALPAALPAAPPPGASMDAVSVTTNAAAIQDLPLSGRAGENYAALTPGVLPPIKLPSKKPVASQLHSGGRTLALDTAGALFLSYDLGKHWTAVTPQWSGKAVQLSFAPTPARLYLAQPSQTQTQSQSNSSLNGNAAASGLPQQQAPIPTAGFELTTATGAVWLSTDGLTWHAR